MRKLFILFLCIRLFALPQNAFAVSDVTEPFSGYTGALSGENGGTGWNAAWNASSAGDFTVQTTGCQSGDCVMANTASDVNTNRTFSTAGEADGVVTFWIKHHDTVDGVNGVFAFCPEGTANCSTATAKFYISHRRASFNDALLASTDGGSVNLGAWTDNSMQLMTIEWGGINGTCTSSEVRAKFNGGSFSSCVTMTSGNNVDGVNLTAGGALGDEIWTDTWDFVFTAAGGGATAEVPINFWTFFGF